MTDCPYCRNVAMSQMRKSFLGPALSVPCRSCGRRVSVSMWAMLAVVPFMLGIALGGILLPMGWMLAAVPLLVGIATMVAIHAVLVPLVPRDG